MEIAPILIYLFVPVVGLVSYAFVIRAMRKRAIPNPPVVSYFVLFLPHGGLLLVALTSLFWEWSGLASLGTAALFFAGPALAFTLLIKNYRKKTLSLFHKAVPIISIGFLFELIVFWLISIG